MPRRTRLIAFDVDNDSLDRLREALPACAIETLTGATEASLTREWDPGSVDLFVVRASDDIAQSIRLCHFLVSCGVLAANDQAATDTQDELPKTLGLHRSRRRRGRRPHCPLLVLLAPKQKDAVAAVLKTGAHSCLLLPVHAKDLASMLAHARTGNRPGRHTLYTETSQTEDRWRDDGGQG